jgi:4-hydroxy-3-polyprenylbenzoate decarboxylase
MHVTRVTLAITGASGAIYGIRLLELLLQNNVMVSLLISDAAKVVIATETDLKLPSSNEAMTQYFCERFKVDNNLLHSYSKRQWMAPIASGSNCDDCMVVCPCSTGTLSAIAVGASRSLIERAADVILKEGKPLFLIPRETPYSPIHLKNMALLAEMGVCILPASPGFYHKPQSIADLVDFIVARILDRLSIPHKLTRRWGSNGNAD